VQCSSAVSSKLCNNRRRQRFLWTFVWTVRRSRPPTAVDYGRTDHRQTTAVRWWNVAISALPKTLLGTQRSPCTATSPRRLQWVGASSARWPYRVVLGLMVEEIGWRRGKEMSLKKNVYDRCGHVGKWRRCSYFTVDYYDKYILSARSTASRRQICRTTILSENTFSRSPRKKLTVETLRWHMIRYRIVITIT